MLSIELFSKTLCEDLGVPQDLIYKATSMISSSIKDQIQEFKQFNSSKEENYATRGNDGIDDGKKDGFDQRAIIKVQFH